MMSNPSKLPSYAPNVLYPGETLYRGYISKGFQVTGAVHIVAGSLCVVLGIVAIGIKAHHSYFGFPIIFGLMFFILGVYYEKPKSRSSDVLNLVMAILSSVFSLAMMIFYIINSALEGLDHCYPITGKWESCYDTYSGRVAVNAILTIIFFMEMVCGIVTATLGCYKACQCCRNFWTMCCYDPRINSNMVYHAFHMGEMPVMIDNQCARPIYIAGGSSGTHTQPGQLMYMSPSPQPPPYGPIPTGMPQNQIQSAPGIAQTQSVPHQPGMVQHL